MILQKKRYQWGLGIAIWIGIIILGSEYELEATMLAFAYGIILIIIAVRWLVRELRFIHQLKNERTTAELQHLKSQVNPHFFFNTLNNLYGLVGKDAKKAQDLILKLSDMMRYSIYEGQKKLVPLEEEIEYIENYIDLHKMRYHKKIEVTFNHSIEQENFLIMPLLFIILVENAFKHGVEDLRDQASVTIDLINERNSVFFRVINNFDPERSQSAAGIGLKNLKRRLELAYPDSHSLSLEQENGLFISILSLKND